MDKLSLALVAFSVFTHAWWNFLTKRAGDKHVFTMLTKWAELIIFLVPAIVVGMNEVIDLHFLFLIGVASIVTFLNYFFLSSAYARGDLSVMYPISRSSLLFLPFLSWYFIDEKINLTGAIGIGMIAVGTLLMPLRSFDRSGWREIGKKSSFLYAILAALTVALYSLWDKIAIQHVNPFLYLYSYTVVVTILYSVYDVYRFSKASIIMEWKANRWPIVQVGFFNVFTYMLVLIAMLYARVTYIGGIRQLSVVVGVMLAQRYLSEKISRPALCGLIISLFGSVVIYFSK